MSTAYPTPPIIGTRVQLEPFNGHPVEYSTVVGFYPEDGAVIVDSGEIIANHLPGYRPYSTEGIVL